MVGKWRRLFFINLFLQVGKRGSYKLGIGNNELRIPNDGLVVRGSQIGSWSEESQHWFVVGDFELFTVPTQLYFGIFRGGVFCFVKNDGF